MKHIQELKKSLTKKRRTIYIDMDGVVADFNLYVSNLLGRQIGWDQHDLNAKEWDILSNIPNLYTQLPLIESSVEMVELRIRGKCRVFVGNSASNDNAFCKTR